MKSSVCKGPNIACDMADTRGIRFSAFFCTDRCFMYIIEKHGHTGNCACFTNNKMWFICKVSLAWNDIRWRVRHLLNVIITAGWPDSPCAQWCVLVTLERGHTVPNRLSTRPAAVHNVEFTKDLHIYTILSFICMKAVCSTGEISDRQSNNTSWRVCNREWTYSYSSFNRRVHTQVY